ncbi:hypothetical protein ACTJKN_24610 [Pedobacter sp. 22163]|uniref:hypothetical protein n=1 Tax=Pedobacter sp. 22163 TaxID=3453883 RepID=UPI003F850D77
MMTLFPIFEVWGCEFVGLINSFTNLGVTPAAQGGGLFRAPLRCGTDEGSVLNPYNP